MHILSDSRSHLLLVFRHWSQAMVGETIRVKIEAEARLPTDLGCFSSSSRRHRRRKGQNLSGTSCTRWYGWKCRWSWGGKRGPESCCLGLIKPSGICYLTAKIMTQLGPHWLSLRADILCYF